VRVYRSFPATAEGHVALTIGNFDGVHRGHEAMLTRLVEAASDLTLPPAVLTFDPHPREFFAREKAPPRLSTVRSKLERFRAAGVARVYIARFNGALAALTAYEFIERVLRVRLGVRWLLVGEDFRFGRERRGDLAVLRDGDLERAQRLLGRPYVIAGRVAHGDKRGKRLGFPTANIVLRHKPALSGIFAVRVHGLGAAPRAGVASVGVRPTVKADARPLLEVFVFDFDESIYGRRIEVEFVHKLRDEERYSDLDALTRQIHADVAQAREYFATHSRESSAI
jgi:riboflavin kinase / FMN adenylyltransferase